MGILIDGIRKKLYHPFIVMLTIYIIFLVTALILDTPSNILNGIYHIMTSRSVLITDYAKIGGSGAMLVNSVLVGLFSMIILVVIGVKPNGAIIMALWLNSGFAFFGKNLFNMIPITYINYNLLLNRQDDFFDYFFTRQSC